MRALASALVGMSLWLAAAGCNLEPLSSDRVELNTCRLQDECSADAFCRNGICMARSTVSPLEIALEVTPRRAPNANEPVPFLFDPFSVDQPTAKEFVLPAAIPISGIIRDAGVVLPASITFTPTTVIPGISVKTVTAATNTGVGRKDADYAVQLFEGLEYRMLVRPTEPHRAPFRRKFIAARDLNLDLEYSDLPKDERTFAVSGAPVGGEVLLNAFDRVTGEPVSSTAALVGGKAKLAFALDADPERLRLDIRIASSSVALPVKPRDGACDASNPAYPVFSVGQAQLATDPNGVARIRLPEAPVRVQYEGTVALCDGDASDPGTVGNLPIALRSTKLELMEDPAGLAAVSYNATTNAIYDAGAREFRFCAEVLPGEYDIVVTPPSGMRCSLFAEHRLIKPPTDGINASGMELKLPEPLYVTGSLQTMETAPLKGASIDGLALGRSDAAVATSGRVTRFNRSQQTTSDAMGVFKLPVDPGTYDIVIKPPSGSGFPWQVRYDVRVDETTTVAGLSSRISMVSPVALEGSLRTDGLSTDPGLDGATVEAYALVRDGADGRRAISVGKGNASADGRFMLLLPPSTQSQWDANEVD